MLFTIYTDTNNPDKKSLIAYDFRQKKITWWRNNYAVSGVNETQVMGTETGLVLKDVVLDLANGQPVLKQSLPLSEYFSLLKPLQYYQETQHFETVKSFILMKSQMSALSVIEYLEYKSLVFISFYVQEIDLANYLLVLNDQGEVLLKERIGEQLKGIGVDTFFILSGYLIFVKNKGVLVSYKMV